jgi:hypothetical protein
MSMRKASWFWLALAAAAAPGCHHFDHHAHRSDLSGGPPLSEAALAIPIRAGQTDAWQRAIVELTGPRYREYESSRRRMGVTSQTTFLQRTPMGDFALIHMTGPDIHRTFHAMSSSQDPWDVKWRQLTQSLHGMDFAKGDAVTPTIEPAFSTGDDTAKGQPYMFMAPVVDVAAFRALAGALTGARRAEYEASRRRWGVSREAVYLETAALGTAMIVYWVAPDPMASLSRMRASTDSFDRWLLSAAAGVHQMNPEQLPITSNVLVGLYPKAL